MFTLPKQCKLKFNLKDQSTEVLKDWFFDCLFLFTHSHIGSHHFQWRGDRKSISIIYSLQTHALFQALKILSKWNHLPPTGWFGIITWSSHFQKFNQRLYHDHNNVTCVQMKGYTLFVASHTYLSRYNRNFVVHMIFFIKSTGKKWTQWRYLQ